LKLTEALREWKTAQKKAALAAGRKPTPWVFPNGFPG